MQHQAFEGLEKLFHEPKRLAIVSTLCAVPKGSSFAELKEVCGLTDGNLSRHLKTLEEARAVVIEKNQQDGRSHTTVHLTSGGRNAFLQYLQALEGVLLNAAEALQLEETKAESIFSETFLKQLA